MWAKITALVPYCLVFVNAQELRNTAMSAIFILFASRSAEMCVVKRNPDLQTWF